MRLTLLDMIRRGGNEPGCWYGRRSHEKHYRQVLKKDPCAYCGRPQPRKAKLAHKLPLQRKATIDHIVPKSTLKNGEGESNWTAACWQCNHRKKDTPLLLFLLEPKGQNLCTDTS